MKSLYFLSALLLNLTFSTDGSAALTRTEFTSLIKTLNTLYKPIAKEHGGNLSILGDWNSGILNAVAEREYNSKNWYVYAFGAMAKIPRISRDGYAIILCHELGHHLGGYPKFTEEDSKWSSSEGQADYFANLKCARKLFEKDDNEAIIKNLNAPAIVSNKCKKSFKNESEINICIRSAMAAKNMTVSLESVRGNAVVDDTINSFETTAPALNRVFISFKHPATQCRLDTLVQASLCDKNVDEKLSDSADTNGICSKSNGDVNGLRPACWYRID